MGGGGCRRPLRAWERRDTDTLTTLLEEAPSGVSERGDQGMTLVHAVVEQDLAAGGLRMGRRHER